VALYQHEWDAFVLLAKNVGPGAVCKSSIVPKLRASQFDAACKTVLDFAGITRVIDGKRTRLSCEVRANGCYGVWRARQAEYRMCSAGEYPK
jgi:lysozyme